MLFLLFFQLLGHHIHSIPDSFIFSTSFAECGECKSNSVQVFEIQNDLKNPGERMNGQWVSHFVHGESDKNVQNQDYEKVFP